MFLIKGLLIFSPVFIYRLRAPNWIERKRTLITWISGIIILIVTFSRLSFAGWLLDYVVFFVGATLILKPLATNLTRTWTTIMQVLTALLLVGYLITALLFGPRLIDKYEKGNMTFRLYRIPDMVLAPTHRLRVTKTWGIIEKFETEEQVRRANRFGTKCMYDFDLVTKRVTTENCKD